MHFFLKSLLLSPTIAFYASNGAVKSKPEVPTTHAIHDTTSQPPTFLDGGRMAKELVKAYRCEGIEYENWEDDDKVDSCLTVCLINSKRLPSEDPDRGYEELFRIASRFKKAVKYPKRYLSYYIIFVELSTGPFGMVLKSHSRGANIPSRRL